MFAGRPSSTLSAGGAVRGVDDMGRFMRLTLSAGGAERGPSWFSLL